MWWNPRVLDLGLAVLTCASLSVLGALFPTDVYRAFDWGAYVLTAVICLPLAARRIAPMTVYIVVSVAYVFYVLAGHLPGLHLLWGPVLAFYFLASQCPPKVTAVAAVLGVPTGYLCGVATLTPPAAIGVQTVATLAAAWGLGNVARRLDQSNRKLADATEQLRREREEHVARMLTQERLRIARELHDVVAHHMSVISVQAGLAGYVFDTDPPAARTAVDTIGDTSREALDEMRRLLALLRVSEDDEPVPRLAELPALVERVRAAGVDVDLRVRGSLDDLPSGLQLTVFRVIQEAVTNVIKYASPCRAEIEVCRSEERLTVTIGNETSRVAVPAEGGGYGLVGMRERARLYGGTLTAGATADGRYAVALTVPLG